MKKRCDLKHPWVFFVKLFCLSLFCLPLSGQSYTKSISVDFNGITLLEALREVNRQGGNSVSYKKEEIEKETSRISLKMTNTPVEKIVEELLKGKAFIPVRQEDELLIVPRKQNEAPAVVTGKVTAADGEPLPGATVVIKGMTVGVATAADGTFRLTLPPGITGRVTLVCSFIGYVPEEIVYTGQQNITVVLQEELSRVDEVVVTGFFTKSRASYTGSVKTIKGEELRMVSGTNLISALASLTPGLNLVEHNDAGSNPNRVPELLLRGMTSFSDGSTYINQPTIILDGVEISMQELYDLDINEIESVNVLKDASATALYGSRAASGVIVIERKRLTEGNIRIAYNLTGNVQFPYLKDYRLLNASEKLEYERLAGLYTAERENQWGAISDWQENQYDLDQLYNERLQEVNRGVDSDWLAQPARTGFSHDHYLRLYGGSSGIRYEVSGRFNNTQGVMKEDYRRRYGIGIKLEYHLAGKLTVANRTNWTEVDRKDSPYGSFSKYTEMNPYDRMYDAYGDPNTNLAWGLDNPLHEALVGNFYTTQTKTFSNTTDFRWDINRLFRVNGNFNITVTDIAGENFTSPDSQTFKNEEDISKKGSLRMENSHTVSYSGNFVGAFNKVTDDNSLIAVNAGFEVQRNRSASSHVTGIGYYDDALSFIGQGAGYGTSGRPSGSVSISAEVGAFVNANYMFRNRYYADAVYRITGSSRFGDNNRYGHFWSGGLGWNLHNEGFISSERIDLLKVRGSLGYTGKANFEPFQAMTIYKFSNDLEYKNGIGAVPQTIGNDDLRWEREFSYNIGADISLFDRRFNLVADFYLKTTKDLVVDESKAPSTGVMTAKGNIGEMENKGFEFQVDGFPIRKNDLYWQLSLTGHTNRNKILKISNALERQNDLNNQVSSNRPLAQYEEGESTSALKVVRSAGIDPATGQEVYIKRNGERTFEYDVTDKVVIGDRNPSFSGTLSTNLYYKGISLYVLCDYKWGGYVYNETRALKVEGGNPRKNADHRVFSSRWKKPGDIAAYKDIANTSAPEFTDRFVDKDNVFSISAINIGYEFQQALCSRLHLRSLRAGVNLTEIARFASAKIERGTSYLYSNGFEFTLSATF